MALAPLMRRCATVFMLHRFRDPERGIPGTEPRALGAALDLLERRGYEIVSLSEVIRRLAGEGPPPQGAISLTLDDGYCDQATVAAPLFAERGLPSTTFVTTGFLDGELWMWWDRIEYVFLNTRLRQLRLQLGDDTRSYCWTSGEERLAAQLDFVEGCKRVADDEKHVAIERLAKAAEVDLPAMPPPQYAPMSWQQLRECEQMGMTFGPHTVTHPVLSRASEEQSRREIAESQERLRSEARRPVQIFCYPNGQDGDFGPREFAALKELGFAGAVCGLPGYARQADFQAEPFGRFQLRRFALPQAHVNILQCTSGFERLKQIVRRER
jgi:peptidoglycan/xylan/chitin deacetylase (PgdA/CDA1 family)